MTRTQKSVTASQDNDRSPSAGTPAEAVPADIQSQLVKSLIPAGAFVTEDHRYYFNGEGPVPSVTTVLEVLDKPALSTWKAQQAVRALYQTRTADFDTSEWTEADAVTYALAQVRNTRSTAASVGTGVHHLADMVLRADVSDPKTWQTDESTQPYLDAFRAFSERYSATSFISSEKAVWSLNGYGGTYDLLMMIPCVEHDANSGPGSDQCMRCKGYLEPLPELWLIDIKTGGQNSTKPGAGLYPEFALQLAAYRWADYIILPGDPTTYDMPNVDRTGVLHLAPHQYPDTGYRLYEYPTTYTDDYMTFLGLLEAYKWRQRQEKPLILKQ